MIKKILILLFSITYISTRLAIALSNEKIFNQYDSPSYFEFSFFSGFRLPFITFVYYFLNDATSIIVFQSLFSSTAFLIVIFTMQKILLFKWQKILVSIFIVLLSFNKAVFYWDNALFSESLATSTFLILTSSIILYFDKSTRERLLFLLIAIVIFSGVKSASAVVALPLLIFIVYYFRKEIFASIYFKSNLVAVLIAAFFVINFFQATVKSDVTATLVTSAHINNRIWPDREWREYLLKKNFPAELRTYWLDRRLFNIGEGYDQGTVNQPQFENWWEREGGENFLISFMLNNPDYLFLGPFFLPAISEANDANQTLLIGWGQDPNIFKFEKPVYAKFNFTFFNERDASTIFLAISFILIGFSLLVLNSTNSKLAYALSLNILVLFLWSYFTWHFGSKPPGDVVRHNFPAALDLRVILIVALVASLGYLKFGQPTGKKLEDS